MVHGIINPPCPPLPASPLEATVTTAGLVRISVAQYADMIERGSVPEDSTVELLRGVLVRKDRSVIGEDPIGHSPLHRMFIRLLSKLAARIDSDHRHLQTQLPVVCPPDGTPEPDGAIIRGADSDYRERLPTAADVTCVIEGSHSSLTRDREDKLPIYAEAGIPQYIIVNLQNQTIEVYESPDPAGRQYRTRTTLEPGQTLALRLPDGSFDVAVSELLPRPI